MFSLFTAMSFIINVVNVLAVIALLVIMVISLRKELAIPNYQDLSQYVKNCYIAAVIFLFSAWLVVSSTDSTQIFVEYKTIAGQARDMGMMWFIVGIAYMVISFILALLGEEQIYIKEGFNLFRNRAFIYGSILCLLSFLLSVG